MMPNSRPMYELNDYQQLMFKISELTPYNAVHAVKLKSRKKNLNTIQADLEFAINEVLQTLDIGEAVFAKDKKKVQFKSLDKQIELPIITSTLHEHVDIEMNQPFLVNSLPLRFFLISTPNSNYLSITYNHWITDAFGISRLIEAIFSYCRGDRSIKLILDSPNMKTCFPSIYGVRAPFYRIITFFKSMQRFLCAYRPAIKDIEKTESGCMSYTFEPEVMHRLRQYCKNEKITINDFFITILAKLFGELTQPERAQCKQKYFKPKRNNIIIGIVSNIRPLSHLDLKNIFSLYLGFFYLSFKDTEKMSFQSLSKDIHLQTEYLKNRQEALKQSLLFKIQNWFWDKKKNTRGKYRLFNKNSPITTGISNMDMGITSKTLQDDIEQYIRFSPTAMICPIGFNLTTFNEHLSLGINFRKESYSIETIDMIQSRFIKAIYDLVVTSKTTRLSVLA